VQAISVRQPLAWAIARGHRPLSNQPLPTCHRGPLLVHASMRIDLNCCELIRTAGWDPRDPLSALGAVIAVAELSDVCSAGAQEIAGTGITRCDCGPWAEPGAHHWRLADVRPLPRPIVTIGRPGLWDPPPALVNDVLARLATSDRQR
jgi:hypothetical protein